MNEGEAAVYKGANPTIAPDETAHYTFSGWDTDLSSITADTVVTAQFTATEHTYTYASADSKHTATCTCGYSKSEAHTWDSGVVTTQPTCTAKGVMTYTCTLCKQAKTEPIDSIYSLYFDFVNTSDLAMT